MGRPAAAYMSGSRVFKSSIGVLFILLKRLLPFAAVSTISACSTSPLPQTCPKRLLPLSASPTGIVPKPYLEGQGDLVTRLIMGIIGVTIWVIGVSNLLTKSP